MERLDFINDVDDDNPEEVAYAFGYIEELQLKSLRELEYLFNFVLFHSLENLNSFLVKNYDSGVIPLNFLINYEYFNIFQIRILLTWASNQKVFLFPNKFKFDRDMQNRNYDELTKHIENRLMDVVEELIGNGRGDYDVDLPLEHH